MSLIYTPPEDGNLLLKHVGWFMFIDNLQFFTIYGYMLLYINNILVCHCHDCFESSLLTLGSDALKIISLNKIYICQTAVS